MSRDINRIIEYIEIEYEFATDDERLNSSLSLAERDQLFIAAATAHLDEICRAFESRPYDEGSEYMFVDAEVYVSLQNYSIENNGDSLTLIYELVYDVDGYVSEDELNEFVSDDAYSYQEIELEYELYCMSDEVTRHFNIINESDVDEIEAIETSFSRIVKFE